MAEKMIEVYDTRSGKKLPRRVPEAFKRIFPYLTDTPKAKAPSGLPKTEKEA